MSFEEIKKGLIHDFFIIVTGTVFGTLFHCWLLAPDVTFSVDYFFWMILFSLAGDVPLLLFYSKKELSEKQWMIRKILHFLVLELLLLGIGNMLEMYEDVLSGVMFALTVAAVYLLVCAIGHQSNRQLAVKLNRRLEKLREDDAE